MLARVILCLLALCISTPQLFADEIVVQAPRAIIYPGETIREDMLVDMHEDVRAVGDVISARAAIVGRIARKTLFPGRPIDASAIEEAKAVVNGGHVQLLYERAGVSISASGQALQSGRTGDVIRVRNTESGLVVTGAIAASGVVVVGR